MNKETRPLTKNKSTTSAFGIVHSPVVNTSLKLDGICNSDGMIAPMAPPNTMWAKTTKKQYSFILLGIVSEEIVGCAKTLLGNILIRLDCYRALLDVLRRRFSAPPGPSSRLTIAAAIHMGQSHFFPDSFSSSSGFVPIRF